MSREQQLRTVRAVSLNRAIDEHADDRLFPWQPNLIDWRHSLVIADKRSDADDPTLEICGYCGCEVDIVPAPHKPGCKGIGKPRVNGHVVLEEAAADALGPDVAASSNTETGPSEVGGVSSPGRDTPRRGDAKVPGQPRGEAERRSVGGASTTRKTYVKWTPELAVERVRELADLLGRPPTTRDAVQNGMSSLHATPTLKRLGFDTWLELRTAALSEREPETDTDPAHLSGAARAARVPASPTDGGPKASRSVGAVTLRDALCLLVHATRTTLDALERELSVEGDPGALARVVVRRLGDDT